MANNKKVDGVIEAVHYRPDGQLDWVRAYLRRGAAWSDRVIITRDELVKNLKAGMHLSLGQRVEYMAGTFDFGAPVKLAVADGKEVLVTSSTPADHDLLEGAPLL